MFDWRVCVISGFQSRECLFPCHSSGTSFLWMNGLIVRRERHGGEGYLRNAWPGPWRVVLIVRGLLCPASLRSSGGGGSIWRWIFNQWRWFHIVLGWRMRVGNFWQDGWQAVWVVCVVIWRLTDWVKGRLIRWSDGHNGSKYWEMSSFLRCFWDWWYSDGTFLWGCWLDRLRSASTSRLENYTPFWRISFYLLSWGMDFRSSQRGINHFSYRLLSCSPLSMIQILE